MSSKQEHTHRSMGELRPGACAICDAPAEPVVGRVIPLCARCSELLHATALGIRARRQAAQSVQP